MVAFPWETLNNLYKCIKLNFFRKANWDLKRDVEKKLSKLERRTKRAMAEMIREKLKAERDIIAGAGQDEGNDSD